MEYFDCHNMENILFNFLKFFSPFTGTSVADSGCLILYPDP
jgi:hypothetical protein